MNSQDLVKFCLLLPTYSLAFCVGLPLNVLVCWVLGRTKKNTMSIYALNLALADLFYLTVVPMKIGYIFSANNWIFPLFLCRVTTLIFFTNIYASIMLLGAISVDRYKAVVQPLEVSRWREPRTAWIVCAVIWVITTVELAPINYVTFTTMVNATNSSAAAIKCYEKFSADDTNFLVNYRLYLFFSLYVPSLVVMLFSYINVIKSLFKVDEGVKVMKRDKKIRAIKLTVLVLGNFFVCFTAYNVSHIVGFIASKYINSMSWESLALLRDIALGLSLFNSLFDPVVAFVASSSFRNSCKRIIKCRMFENQVDITAT